MITQTIERPRTFQDILSGAREWNRVHSPWDYGSKLNLFQYVWEEGDHGTLVPLAQKPSSMVVMPSPGQTPNSIALMPHAHRQLLDRLEYPEKVFEKLPTKFNLLAINYLIQNHYARDVLFRLQDANQARAMLSVNYEPFDHMDLLNILEPFCQDAEVRWYHQDDMTLHISVTWPRTQEEVKVGDVVQRGLHVSNSEVGLRSVTIAGYVWRLKCKNGAIGGEGAGIRRFRHMGDRDSMRDKVRAAIEETHLQSERIISQFKAAVNKAVEDPFTYLEQVAKDKNNQMTQEEFKTALDAFMLEPDPTLYGVTNAITRAAQKYAGDERWEMERLGVKVLTAGLRK